MIKEIIQNLLRKNRKSCAEEIPEAVDSGLTNLGDEENIFLMKKAL